MTRGEGITNFIKEYEETGVKPIPNQFYKFDMKRDGQDIFYIAVKYDYEKTIKLIIDEGFVPNKKENAVILKWALLNYDIETHEKLLTYGLDIESKYKYNREVYNVERIMKRILRYKYCKEPKLSSRYLRLEKVLKYILDLRARSEEFISIKFKNNILNISSKKYNVNNEIMVDVINILSSYNILVININTLKESIKFKVKPINETVKEELVKMLLEELEIKLQPYIK